MKPLASGTQTAREGTEIWFGCTWFITPILDGDLGAGVDRNGDRERQFIVQDFPF